MSSNSKLESPSAERNKELIWNVLNEQVFSKNRDQKEPVRVLEIAAGTGVHSHHFCKRLLDHEHASSIQWFPTDPEDASRDSINAYRQEDGVSSILQPPMALTLDENGIVEQNELPAEFDLIVCINMIHISPWDATVGLMKAAQKLLKPNSGVLYCYGPYRENGTAVESNLYVLQKAAFCCASDHSFGSSWYACVSFTVFLTTLCSCSKFEQWLKARDPGYGVRNLEDVAQLAESCNMELVKRIEMPANNLSVLYGKKI